VYCWGRRRSHKSDNYSERCSKSGRRRGEGGGVLGRSGLDAAPPTQADFGGNASAGPARAAAAAGAATPAVSTSTVATAERLAAAKIPDSEDRRGGRRCRRGVSRGRLVGVAAHILAPQHGQPEFPRRGPHQLLQHWLLVALLVSPQAVCANAAPSEAPVQGLNTQEWIQGHSTLRSRRSGR
jgi:hypothetical protein